MVALSGSWTPWSEWEDADQLTYVRDGHRIGDIDLLVEAVRADGIVSGLGESYRLVDTVRFETGYYGHVDDQEPHQRCDENGTTPEDDQVQSVTPCIFALMGDA